MKKAIVLLSMFGLAVCASPIGLVHAQTLDSADDNLKGVTEKIGGNFEGDLPTMIGTIIKAVLSLVGLIFFVLTVYAGFLWMTARGEDEKISKSKEILKSSIAGLFIVVSAYAITYFVTSRFSS